MGQMGEWVPPNAPLSEGYWKALLRDGQSGKAAPTVNQVALWDEQGPDASEESAESADPSTKPSSFGPLRAGSSTSLRAGFEEWWEEARHLMEQGEILKLPVVGCNQGGVLVAWNDMRGFVPASHLLDLSLSTNQKERQAELRQFIGRRLPLKIIELDPERNRLVLSERATRVDESQRDDVLSSLRPGDVCQGRVTNLCSFGAFVDLGGFEGLIHISELSWGRVGHPDDVLEPGQPVEVYVLNVEPERKRVGLSIKRLQPNPWHSVEERYQAGQVVDGTVTHVVDFGAFVQVEKGLEGLVHVSELTGDNSRDPQNVVREGDDVKVEVLNIDGERRRMSLRLRRV